MSHSARRIEEVISDLQVIVQDCAARNDPKGYFAALYLKVTVKVRDGINAGFFEDGRRMEELDVVFAQRYLDAYHAYQNHQALTASWALAFDATKRYWPIVLQHLLLGINAHINLDLGIAAATISKGKNLEELHVDFNRINEILAALVNEVENDLVTIWPTMGKLIKKLAGAENLLLDFSMQIARDGAWQFAQEMALTPASSQAAAISSRDEKVKKIGQAVTSREWYIRLLFNIIRLGERGTVSAKIKQLS